MDKSKANETSQEEAYVERRDFLGGAATLAGTSLLGLGLPAVASAAAPADMAQDRMPPIPADKMTEEQKKAAEILLSGPRKAVDGPFVPLLRSPEFMNRLQKTGEYLRFNTKLGPINSEFIILIAARFWTQQFEWDTHAAIAAKQGVKPEVIAAIAEGRRPTDMTPDHEMLHNFCTELLQNKSVSDASYAPVLNRFGEGGVIDITGLVGYYSLLGMVMNVARSPVPGGKPLPLPYFPH